MISSRYSFTTDRGHEGADHAQSLMIGTCDSLPPFPRLEGDLTCDVAVIGGGFCGVSAALELARAGKKTVLLEANRIGYGATGRNGGQVHLGFSCGFEKVAALTSDALSQQCWHWALESRRYLDYLMTEEAIDCDFQPGYVFANHRARFADGLARHVDLMRKRYQHEEIRYLSRAEVRDELGAEGLFEGYYDGLCGHLHPLKLLFGLARKAEAAGALFYESSRVRAIRRHGEGYRITTAKGVLRADAVLLAVNGLNDGLERSVEQRVIPLVNFIIATEPLDEDLCRNMMPNRVSACDSRSVINYWRITRDRRLVYGGGEAYGRTFPRDIASVVRPHLLRTYPHLADTKIDYAWGGTLGITRHRIPYVSQLDHNFLTAVGFSGQGVINAPYTGRQLALKLLGRDNSFDLLAGLPCSSVPLPDPIRSFLSSLALRYYALLDHI